jgi:RNA polymerase sigma factor (sigma-70 family)
LKPAVKLGMTLDTTWMIAEQDRKLSEAVEREQGRLRNFIRRRVADKAEAEDILQDVFYELVEAYRLMKPIEQVGAWLFRVARNRIIDALRKKKPEAMPEAMSVQRSQEQGINEPLALEELLPSPDAGPEAEYARSILLDELDAALEELPDNQRDVFVAHEIEGQSFKQISIETGVSVNTLLSRKHHAVLHLRQRLQSIYDEFTNRTGESLS